MIKAIKKFNFKNENRKNNFSQFFMCYGFYNGSSGKCKKIFELKMAAKAMLPFFLSYGV